MKLIIGSVLRYIVWQMNDVGGWKMNWFTKKFRSMDCKAWLNEANIHKVSMFLGLSLCCHLTQPLSIIIEYTTVESQWRVTIVALNSHLPHQKTTPRYVLVQWKIGEISKSQISKCLILKEFTLFRQVKKAPRIKYKYDTNTSADGHMFLLG